MEFRTDMCVLRGAMIVPISLFGKWSSIEGVAEIL